MITFVHTADWQLGKPYGALSNAGNRVLLQEERYAAIGRIKQVVVQSGAAFVVVAGDLFDSPSPERNVVSRACAAIGALGVPVYVIPGNHDHGGPLGPWEHAFFLQERNQLAPNLHVLLESTPIELDGAVLFPCPLTRRHESDDLTTWLRQPHELLANLPVHAPRIVLAHGSIQDFGGDRDDDERSTSVNQLDLDAFDHAHWDYLALGDWHGCKQVAPMAWYAGTPEPDRFPRGADYEAGQVLVVKAQRGQAPVVTPYHTGGIGWHMLSHTFLGNEDLELLRTRYEALIGQRVSRDLLKLELSGALGIAAQNELSLMLETWATRLLRLDLRGHVSMTATEDDIMSLTNRTGDPVTARIATILRDRLASDAKQDRDLAEACLRELHLAVYGEG
jgi:DNA repair exonuclease SbcCD nuclease subunit